MPNNITLTGLCSQRYDDAKEDYKQLDLPSMKIDLETRLLERLRPLQDEWSIDYASKHWGTKWNAYDCQVFELNGDGMPILVQLCFAWSPPNNPTMLLIEKYLLEQYDLENFTWSWHNPFDNKTHYLYVHRPKRSS